MTTTLTVAAAHSALDWATASSLLDDYFRHLEQTFNLPPITKIVESAAAELTDPRSVFDRPGGGLLLATSGATGLGIVALRPTGNDAAVELTRCYVRPLGRGRGLGRRLVSDALTMARAVGHRRVFLDTVPGEMATAVGIYRSFGFTPAGDHDLPVEGAQRFVLDLT